MTPRHQHPEPSRARPALLFAAALTAAVFAVELWGGLRSGSLALLSDAGHVLMDLTGILLTLFALHLSGRLPSKRRTYGLHRLEVLAALANGLLLSGMAGGILWQSVHRISSPRLPDLGPMMGVAALGLLANLLVAWKLREFSKKDLNLHGAFLHVASDALASVGVIAAGAGMALTGWAVLDPLVGLAIAVVIFWNALRLLREALNILLEGVPRSIRLEEVLTALAAVSGVVRVTDAHLWGICSHLLSLSAHVVITPERLADQRRVLEEISTLLWDGFGIHHVTLQLESSLWSDVPSPG